jgi:hypothetical protein
VKLAVAEPAGTVTEAGTVTALDWLVSVTTEPPVGAAVVKVTVQASVVGEVAAHASPVSGFAAVPRYV